MKLKKVAAATAWALAWAALLIYTGVFGTYRLEKDFEANVEIGRLNGEVRALENVNAQLELRNRELDRCLQPSLVRVERESLDLRGAASGERVRLVPLPPRGCYEWSLGAITLVGGE